MYDAVAEMAGVSVESAVPAETATYQETARAVQGSLLQSETGQKLSQVAVRLVKQAGADTTIKNAIRDGAEWAWVPMGDTCAFCITLASRGWQYASKRVLKGNHATHIHANCNCQFAIRFDGKSGVAGYDPDKYRRLYDNAEGRSSKDKVNALRRERYAENKDKINAQKRVAYAQRKNALVGEQSAKTLFANNGDSSTIELDIVKNAIESGKVSTTINADKQNRHIKDSGGYIEGRSYINGTVEDAQKLVDELSGTGELVFKPNGEWNNKEKVEANKVIGVDVNPSTMKETDTTKATIHYSKTGSHIVPRKEG